MTLHESLSAWSSWWWPLFANHLWQATILSILALVATGLLRRSPAQVRYAVLLIASAKFLLPSFLLILLAGQAGLDLAALFTPASAPRGGATSLYQIAAPIIEPGETATAG